tara:strand:- start:479 stop:733 length:255 start_codon:yes stop_codon:yes gene_type:complete
MKLFFQSAESLAYAMGKNPKNQAEQNKFQDEYHRMKGYPKPLLRWTPVHGFNPAGGYNEKATKQKPQIRVANTKKRSLMKAART